MTERYRVVRFEGVVDIGRYPEFREVFASLPRTVPVLVDLTGCEAVDSVFLSEVLLAKRRHASRFVMLVAPDGHVARLAALVQFEAKVDMFTDRSEAVAALGPLAGAGGRVPDAHRMEPY